MVQAIATTGRKCTDDAVSVSYTHLVRCPKCSSLMMRRWTTKNGKKSYFWGCSKYPECKTTLPDRNGKPVFEEMGYHLKKKQGKTNAGSFRYKKPTE